MNRIITFFSAIIVATSVFAQSPEKMSYQAVIRNSEGLVCNQQVGMQISILQGAADGTPVYIETQTPTTNANGLVTIEIGTGETSDDFSVIDWTSGIYFINTETDPTGSTNYTITGTSQLLSVPYALHAKAAGTITETITESQISDLQAYLTVETDPIFIAWDKASGIVITESQISDLQAYLIVETDPIFTAWDKASGIVITESQISDLQTYLTAETDPSFTAWDKSTDISITESQISDLQTYLTAETDPVYSSSHASNITATDITNLSNLSGSNTGDQNLSHLATRANVLELDNTSAFTPNADYEPATLKYVNDAIDAATSGHYIGELYGGGMVFWVTPDGANGLIASLDDLDGGGGVFWGLLATPTGSTSMTDGAANTATIIASSPGAGTAAVLCDEYSGGGYADWYLPSDRELYLLASQDILIDYILDNDSDASTNGFSQEYIAPTNGGYWCSTEFGGDNAWTYRFYSGNMNVSTKNDLRKVRAIRAF